MQTIYTRPGDQLEHLTPELMQQFVDSDFELMAISHCQAGAITHVFLINDVTELPQNSDEYHEIKTKNQIKRRLNKLKGTK